MKSYIQVYGIFMVLFAGALGSNYVDPSIYTFAFPGIPPGSYYNGTVLSGPRLELMKEVCCRAGKRCDVALVESNKCWSRDGISQVLNNRWYDACVDILDSSTRRASYAFSDLYFFSTSEDGLSIAVGKHSNLTLDDFRNPRNNITVAWTANVNRKNKNLRVFLDEFFVPPENEVLVKGPDVPNKIVKLITNPCSGVDAGLVGNSRVSLSNRGTFKILKNLEFHVSKPSVMVRKDAQHILEWWDFTLKMFMCSEDWKPFCHRMDKQFGAHPMNCPPLDQIDCTNCSVPHRVSGCPCTEERK